MIACRSSKLTSPFRTTPVKLIQLDHGQDTQTHELPELPTVLGRQPARGIAIPHPTISREHARIFDRDGETFVADLNSSNGTFVNGARVSRCALKHGDLLKLGEVELRVEVAGAIAPTAIAPPAAPVAASRPAAPSRPTPTNSSGQPLPTAAELFGEDDGITLEEATISSTAAPGTETMIASRPFAASSGQGPGGFAQAPPKSVYSAAVARPLDPKKAGNLLTADVDQQGGWRKLLTLIIALGVAAGLFYGAMSLTESMAPEDDLPPAQQDDADGATNPDATTPDEQH